MLTELCLGSDEFDHFAVQSHKSITFCLKELRARLNIKTMIKKAVGMEHNSLISILCLVGFVIVCGVYQSSHFYAL